MSGRGSLTEGRVVEAAGWMAARGIALLAKQATPRTIIPDGSGGFRAFNSGKAPIDFIGSLGDGSAVFVEVKEESGPSLSLGLKRLTLAQRDALDEALRFTPHVYLLAAFLPRARTSMTPGRRGYFWMLLPWTLARTLDKVDPADGSLWGFVAGDLFLDPSTLANVRAHEEAR